MPHDRHCVLPPDTSDEKPRDLLNDRRSDYGESVRSARTVRRIDRIDASLHAVDPDGEVIAAPLAALLGSVLLFYSQTERSETTRPSTFGGRSASLDAGGDRFVTVRNRPERMH